MRKLSKRISVIAGAAFLAATGSIAAGIGGASADAAVTQTTFHMVRSAASVKANCLKGADAKVTIESEGPVEVMRVSAKHLPPNTDFDLFVIQVPNAPFGIGWYQGDLESNSSGHANGTFIGRFSVETFAVAPGSAPAPQVFNGPFPDASVNPPFNPVQMYHLGLRFISDCRQLPEGTVLCPLRWRFHGGEGAGSLDSSYPSSCRPTDAGSSPQRRSGLPVPLIQLRLPFDQFLHVALSGFYEPGLVIARPYVAR